MRIPPLSRQGSEKPSAGNTDAPIVQCCGLPLTYWFSKERKPMLEGGRGGIEGLGWAPELLDGEIP